MPARPSFLDARLPPLSLETGRGQRIDIRRLESPAEYPLYYAFDGVAPPPRTGASHATIYPYGAFPAETAQPLCWLAE